MGVLIILLFLQSWQATATAVGQLTKVLRRLVVPVEFGRTPTPNEKFSFFSRKKKPKGKNTFESIFSKHCTILRGKVVRLYLCLGANQNDFVWRMWGSVLPKKTKKYNKIKTTRNHKIPPYTSTSCSLLLELIRRSRYWKKYFFFVQVKFTWILFAAWFAVDLCLLCWEPNMLEKKGNKKKIIKQTWKVEFWSERARDDVLNKILPLLYTGIGDDGYLVTYWQ